MKTLKQFLKSQPEIIFAYLFGSRAKGTVHALSDTDIAIYIHRGALLSAEAQAYGYIPSLLAKLPKRLQKQTIDIVILNQTPILLRHRCLYDGTLLFTKDKRLLTKLKVQTLLEYLDTKPLREKIHRGLYEKK
ncbi:MAG: nucleotidyltransferase domain-containing protein [Deltaproteobacteria bacterium]|nr:nucleotidyltransferase domain-containing protein [Deltaproteobacteria bacterium]